MANKRTLKKEIRNICGSLAAEVVMAIQFIPDIDAAKMDEIIGQIAGLQENALRKVDFVFDKSPRDFESPSKYKQARRAYFAQGYHSLIAEFNKGVEAIVKEMNGTLTDKQRELNKQAAQ